MPLRPTARYLLDQVHRPAAQPYHLLEPTAMRHESQKLHFAFRPTRPEIPEVRDFTLERPDGSALPVRLYRARADEERARVPLLVYFHGGGFTVGDLASFDVLCRELALGSGFAVVSVDYRLAPEHPFPAAVEDAAFALAELARRAGELGADPNRIAVAGDSAGGNLALVAALMAEARGAPRLIGQVLVYPMCDQRSHAASRRAFAEGHLLTAKVIERFQSFYLTRPSDYLDWRASPLLAPDFSGLPPTLVISAEYDPLIDDVRALVARLQRSGVAVDHREFAGMIHGFFPLGKLFEEAREAVSGVAAWLRARR